METKSKFSWRAFTSLYITLSFIIMIVSGLVLYIAPPGRIAKWAYVPILGLEKDQWQALHTIFTFLFIVANGFHLYFNWKPFLSYLKSKQKQFFRLRGELLSAFLITIGIFYLVLFNSQPFKGVMDFGESMKNTWSTKSSEPPVPHAEEMTMEKLAKTLDKDVADLIRHLENQGISAEANSVIKDLAREYDISAQEIFEKLKIRNNSQTGHDGPKRGYGRMTVIQICNQNNIALQDALLKLESLGVSATGESNLREVAQQCNKSPIEIVEIIKDSENN